MDQMGKLPSGFLPRSMGRLINGCEAIEINKDIKEVYKNGIDNNMKPKRLRQTKNRNKEAAFNPIKTEIPRLIFPFLKTTIVGKNKNFQSPIEIGSDRFRSTKITTPKIQLDPKYNKKNKHNFNPPTISIRLVIWALESFPPRGGKKLKTRENGKLSHINDSESLSRKV